MSEYIQLLKIFVPAGEYEALVALLALETGRGWEELEAGDGLVEFRIYGSDRQKLEKLASLAKGIGPDIKCVISEVEKQDWSVAWRQFFTPVEVGKSFVVLPPWLAHLEHGTRKSIIIDPGNAFGTGHHASTTLCLAALEELIAAGRVDRHGWFLDIGCGSGILGLAACTAGMDGTGIDIDADAVANARENRELNGASRLEVLEGGIEKVRGEKFDLVMANILAGPLIDMAPGILELLDSKGAMILGGILDTQAGDVADAYMAGGLGEPQILADGRWRALVWK